MGIRCVCDDCSGGSCCARPTVPSAYPYAVVRKDTLVAVNTDADRVINLPAANKIQCVTIKDASGVGAGTHTVTINPAGADTIDIVAGPAALITDRGALRFQSDGVSNWLLVGRF